MRKSQALMGWNGRAAKAQVFLRGYFEGAQNRFVTLETEAGKALKQLVERTHESRKGLDALLSRTDWLHAPAVRKMGQRAEAATSEARKRLDQLQTRVVEAAGMASQAQMKEIVKEIGKLSRKVDALVSKKGARTVPRA